MKKERYSAVSSFAWTTRELVALVRIYRKGRGGWRTAAHFTKPWIPYQVCGSESHCRRSGGWRYLINPLAQIIAFASDRHIHIIRVSECFIFRPDQVFLISIPNRIVFAIRFVFYSRIWHSMFSNAGRGTVCTVTRAHASVFASCRQRMKDYRNAHCRHLACVARSRHPPLSVSP